MSLAEVAEARFQEGYSCSQSVFSALAGPWGIDAAVALKVAAAFGGGMARSAGTCGCVTGALMAIGLAQRSISPAENRTEKEKTYEAARQFMRAFKERNGSLLCSELLGCNISTPEGIAQARQEKLFGTRCPKFVRDAVEIVQEMTAAGTLSPPAVSGA
ncbi:MAG TPA: C-GCAxxG-C-C family protein [Bryobacteraceae bacterium]|nr:C-GCAxxG-C-C family protein [Bryobacteraceae bacterium]HOQ45073.1 C-GCAxxG-C-C family protein [Bryobacteraceae bacterium]HPQ15917.1 C-GCAxxG-C-C family protein [Bryobacteraceae bacterium]HPU71145.1 C-GCAxxG-C-C family protein [Bryobacteraceae bacterium]